MRLPKSMKIDLGVTKLMQKIKWCSFLGLTWYILVIIIIIISK